MNSLGARLISQFKFALTSSQLLVLLTILPGIALITAKAQAAPNFQLQGWAATGEGTTGGAGGEVITVTTPQQFMEAVLRPEPLIMLVSGRLDFAPTGRRATLVASNKSILGIGNNAEIANFDLSLSEVSNIIIRNIRFRGAPDTAIGIRNGTTRVWIDHNDFADAADGLVDVTRGSDLVTVSWNRFSNHTKTSLVGASSGHTGDRDRLRVTFHNNWFNGSNERHPLVRFGRVHVFNNMYDNVSAGIGVGWEAKIVSERNYFENTTTPWHFWPNEPNAISDDGSIIINAVNMFATRPHGIDWAPGNHYTYTLSPASDVPNLVRTYTGVGIIDPMDPTQPTEPSEPNEPVDPPEPNEPSEPLEPGELPEGVIAHYPLMEGTGNTAGDQSGRGNPVNLNLIGGAAWINGGGIQLDGATARLESQGAATKLTDEIAATGQFSVEIWANPSRLGQFGPARIISYSAGHSLRNFTLGHGMSNDPTNDLIFRVRTTGDNLQVNAGQEIASGLSHYAITFDGSHVRVYRNGHLKHTAQRAGELDNWNRDYLLVFGNEPTGDRGWAGEIHEITIYNRALPDSVIQERASSPPVPSKNAVTFSNWLETAYSAEELSNPHFTGPSADPGNRGVPNILRYALGLDPRNPDKSKVQRVSLQQDPISGYTFLTIEHPRLRLASCAKIRIEVSEDLANWTILGEEAITKIVSDGDMERVTVRDPNPTQEGEQGFMRLRVDYVGDE